MSLVTATQEATMIHHPALVGLITGNKCRQHCSAVTSSATAAGWTEAVARLFSCLGWVNMHEVKTKATADRHKWCYMTPSTELHGVEAGNKHRRHAARPELPGHAPAGLTLAVILGLVEDEEAALVAEAAQPDTSVNRTAGMKQHWHGQLKNTVQGVDNRSEILAQPWDSQWGPELLKQQAAKYRSQLEQPPPPSAAQVYRQVYRQVHRQVYMLR
jgi:hypothetical protein